MIPKNNLDDRTFDDIVAEAIRLIPRYCPEWTNHNPTDPGITLIELFAWMTEMTLYRLNKVPEKTYLSLLELMGLSLIPPQPARSVVQFFLVEGYRKSIQIDQGTQVAAVVAEDTCLFETEKKLQVHGSKLVSCVNRTGEQWTDFCTENNSLQPFILFDAQNTVEHVLYISSPLCSYLSGENYVQICFESALDILSVQDEIVNYLYWEYWDGRSWVHIQSHATFGRGRKKDNTVYITGPAEMQSTAVNGFEDVYLRAVLSEIPAKQSVLSIKGISLQIFFGGSGFVPDSCLVNTGNIYTSVDMNTSFRMYSEQPAYNEIFYIAADDVFRHFGTKIRVYFTFSELYVIGDENDDAFFSYEFWDGDTWQRFDEKNDFHDGTFGFKQSGEVIFSVPEKIKPALINNEERYWLRIRLQTKDFSIGGEYVRDDKNNWIWKFNKKVHSPLISKIRLVYEAKPRPPQKVFSYTNFSWHDLKCLYLGEPQEIEVFRVTANKSPALFLGFSAQFPKGDISLYIKINETLSSKPKRKRLSAFDALLKDNEKAEKRLTDILWHYWNGSEWYPLSVNDYTDSFHESGFVEFAVPADMAFSTEFDKELIWLKICLLSGSFEKQPEIEAVLLNAVYTKNVKTHKNEIVGSGTGAPGQTVIPAHTPLLPGLQLSIDEGAVPSANELEIIKTDSKTIPYTKEAESVWIPYTEVENFYNSTPFSRHFVVDYQTSRIYFGDGQHGVIPVRKKFNIRLDSYETGGGTEGNVAANTLRILSQNIPFIAGCDNPFPAEGGSDMETVNSLKSRAAGVFKSLHRAVTVEDFEWLSREASASVGRACCLNERRTQGEIVVIIIPVQPKGSPLGTMLTPSRELIRRVKMYLDERKLVGSQIKVQAPIYRSFSVLLSLSFMNDVLDTEKIKKNIRTALYTYFHVLNGSSGTGWELGKAVTVGIVLKQLEKVGGILSIDKTELVDEDTGITGDKLVLKNDEFPFLCEIKIENRRETE